MPIIKEESFPEIPEKEEFVVNQDDKRIDGTKLIPQSVDTPVIGEYAIGGWRLRETALTSSSGAVGLSSEVTAGVDWRIWAGNTTASSAPFRVDESGNLVATSAIISGAISASTIDIGGADTTSFHVDVNGNIWAGAATYDLTTNPFAVSNDGNLVANNARIRGKISTSVFEKDTISSVGGKLIVSNADILNVDMTALDASTLTIVGDTTFAVNDMLIIADGVDTEYMRVTNVGSAPTYTVTRDLAAAYAADTNPIWKKGTCVTVYGSSDGVSTYSGGWLYMIGAGTNSPYYSVIQRTGVAYNAYTEYARLGNLNGFIGYSTNLYGLAIGDSSNYLSYDTTNKLRIVATQGDAITINNGSNILFKTTAEDTAAYIGWENDSIASTETKIIGSVWESGTTKYSKLDFRSTVSSAGNMYLYSYYNSALGTGTTSITFNEYDFTMWTKTGRSGSEGYAELRSSFSESNGTRTIFTLNNGTTYYGYLGIEGSAGATYTNSTAGCLFIKGGKTAGTDNPIEFSTNDIKAVSIGTDDCLRIHNGYSLILLSADDDKYIQMYHDDTNSIFLMSSGSSIFRSVTAGSGRISVEETATGGVNNPGFMLYNETVFKGGIFYNETSTRSEIWATDDLMIYAAGNNVYPDAAGDTNLGTATLYWNDVSYKTLTDRGCLGFFDTGVEMPNGKTYSDLTALSMIQVRKDGKKTIYGKPMLDYRSFPVVSYKKADKKGKLIKRDKNDEPVEGADGIEMTSIFSIILGAFKEINDRLIKLEKQVIASN